MNKEQRYLSNMVAGALMAASGTGSLVLIDDGNESHQRPLTSEPQRLPSTLMSKNLTDFLFRSFLHLSALAVSFCRNTNSTQQVYCLFSHVILKNKLRKRLALTSLKWKQNSWNVPYVTPSSRHVIFLVKCIDMKLFPEVPSKTLTVLPGVTFSYKNAAV